MTEGRVIRTNGPWHDVRCADGQQYACQLRGKLRLQASKTTAPVVIGDHVQLIPQPTPGQGIIYAVLPRKNYLMRQASHRKGYGQLLAANLDLACLVTSAVSAAAQCLFIDRFLVAAEALDITPSLVFNKIDLLNDEQQASLATLHALYQTLGYDVWALSAHTGSQLALFRQALQGKVVVLSGPSGAGKSTLVNALAPAAQQAVAPTFRTTQRGRHTTTHAALFEIGPHTYIADTPGIQSLVPHAVDAATVGHYFPEIRALAAGCQFHNCTHLHEPGCAVRQGNVVPSRYASYRTIVAEAAND